METWELILLIMGILVVVIVIIAVSLFFKDQIIALFKGFSVGKPTGAFLALLK